jgi:hypothetical protein
MEGVEGKMEWHTKLEDLIYNPGLPNSSTFARSSSITKARAEHRPQSQ